MSDLKSDFNLKDCVWTLAHAWENVTTDTLKNTWHNLWPATLFMEESDVEENNFKGFAVETNEVIRFADGFVLMQEGLKLMKDCITFMETNKNVSEQEVMSLYRVHERLTSERNKNLKQTTMEKKISNK